MLTLQSGDPALYTDVIVQGCVENLQYDRQCEENRGTYFMRLIEVAHLQDRVREAILVARPKSEEEWDRDWMVDLLEEFALRGDKQAWLALRDIAAGGDERAQDSLAETDEAGLEWVAEHVLPNLPVDERYRIGFWLPDDPKDDVTPLQRRLRSLDQENDVRMSSLRKAETKSKPSARRILTRLKDPKAPYVSRRDLAEVVSRKVLREVAERLLRAKDHQTAWRLAWVFRYREFPLSAHRLIVHATHEERGMAVCSVLGKIDSPQVRHFALKLLRMRPLPWNAVEALTASARRGDEVCVAAALPDIVAYGRKHRHSIILDVLGLLEKYPKGRWQFHAEWIYEHSPCSRCRASAVRWMAEHGAIPDAVREEAPYDAEPDVWEMATA